MLLTGNMFHNDFWPQDVDNSLKVTPLDALHVINALNDGGARQLAASTAGEGENPSTRPQFIDVNGDDYLSPIDALQVIDTLNKGEGEVAPDDVVRYMVEVFKQDGTALPKDGQERYLVGIGETFQLRGTVQDNRTGGIVGDPFNSGSPSGVFAAYLDLLFDNKNLFQIRYGETQRLNVTAPAGSGSFTLTFNGGTSATINRVASTSVMRSNIQTQMEGLVGAGNVEVTIPITAGGNAIFDIRFKGAFGEANQPAIVVNPNFTSGGATITDNYHPADPTDAGTFQSSFNLTRSPYINGPSAVPQSTDEDAGYNPTTGTVFGEVGTFLDFGQVSTVQQNPGDERVFFSVDVKAMASGTLGIWASPADTAGAATLVISNPSSPNPDDQFTVAPANIGFVQNPAGTALHTDAQDPNYTIQHNAPLDSAHKINVLIRAPVNVTNDDVSVLEDSGTTAVNVLQNDSVDTGAGGVGTLSIASISGVTPPGSATIAIAGTAVNFTPTLNYTGDVTFTYTAQDQATPPHTGTGTVTVHVMPVNDGPVITLTPLPGPIDEDEGAVPVPAGTVVVADVDAGAAALQATITVTGGTLTLNDTTGLAFTTGDGNADANMVFTGTLTALNNAANNATFNTAQNFNGTATVTITVNDQGNTGTGGAKSDTKVLSIVVTPLNDPPVNTVPPAQTVIEFETLTFAPVISTTDVEVLAAGASVQVNLDVDNGKLNLGTQTGLTNVSGLGTDAVSFQGTLANVNAALATLTYQANAFPQNDTLTITTSDLGTAPLPVMTDTDQVQITVLPSTRPSAVPDSATVAEDSGATTVDVLVNDIDVNSAVGPTNLIITTASDPAGGTVVVAGDGKSLTYQPDLNFFGNDTFTYTIASTLPNQGDGPSTTTVYVTVNGLNDSPTITMAPAVVTTAEDTAFTFVGASQLAVADVDADAATTAPGVLVTLSVSHGTLAPGATANVTVTGNGTGTLTIAGKVADVNAALNNATYTPAQNWDQADTLQFTVDDRGNTGGGSAPRTDTRAIPITVTPVNDGPTITAPTTDVVTSENTPLDFLASGPNKVAVADVDSPTLAVGLTVTNGTLKLKQTTGLTFNSGADNSAAMNFTGTIAAINAALDGLRYTPTQNYEGPATLGITANDGQASDAQDVSLIVSGVNDPPVNNLPATAQTNEDVALVFAGANLLSVTDTDAGSGNVLVSVAVTHGVFAINPLANMTGVTVTGNGTASVTLSGPLPTINGGLNGSTYTPTLNFNTPDTGIQPTLTITSNDNGNTGTGGAKTDTDTLPITVNPTNDPPVANDDGSPTNRTTVLWNTTNNPFAVLTNDSILPDVGETLTITNVDTTNAHGTVTIQGQQLLYTPTANYTGSAEIVYTINDRPDGSGLTDTATVYIQVVDYVRSDLAGRVYVDFDNDGVAEEGEPGLAGVTVTLTGTNVQGAAVNLTARTGEDGSYLFEDVLPSQTGTTYTVRQTQPHGFIDGRETVGDQGGSSPANDQLAVALPMFGYAAGIHGTGNNFAETGLAPEYLSLRLRDILASDVGCTSCGAQHTGVFFATDLNGRLLWYINVGGWEDYIPGVETTAGSNNFQVIVSNNAFSVTDHHTVTSSVRTVSAPPATAALRQAVSGTGIVTHLIGTPDDFGLPAYGELGMLGAEGEAVAEDAATAVLASTDNADQYAAAVDAILGSSNDLLA